MCIRYGTITGAIFRSPLVFAGGALGQLPFIVEQVFEKAHVPLNRFISPCAFEATGNRIGTFAGAIFVFPAETLLFNRSCFRVRAVVLFGSGTMNFTKRMSSCNKRNGFLIIHRHPFERLTNEIRRLFRVWFSTGSLRVYVDQTHVIGCELPFKISIIVVALISQPLLFRSPIDVILRFPGILTSAAKTKGFKAHRFQCTVSGQDHQIAPREFLTIFLLDRPEQATSFVEAHVVGPTVNGSKTLVAGSCSSAPIGYAIRASTVPRHPYE